MLRCLLYGPSLARTSPPAHDRKPEHLVEPRRATTETELPLNDVPEGDAAHVPAATLPNTALGVAVSEMLVQQQLASLQQGVPAHVLRVGLAAGSCASLTVAIIVAQLLVAEIEVQGQAVDAGTASLDKHLRAFVDQNPQWEKLATDIDAAIERVRQPAEGVVPSEELVAEVSGLAAALRPEASVVPEVTYLPPAVAIGKLLAAGLRPSVSGAGTEVVAQTPRAREVVAWSSTVTLRLG